MVVDFTSQRVTIIDLVPYFTAHIFIKQLEVITYNIIFRNRWFLFKKYLKIFLKLYLILVI